MLWPKDSPTKEVYPLVTQETTKLENIQQTKVGPFNLDHNNNIIPKYVTY